MASDLVARTDKDFGLSVFFLGTNLQLDFVENADFVNFYSGFIWRLLISLMARLLAVIADDLVPACKLFWVWGFFMGCFEERGFCNKLLFNDRRHQILKCL